MPRRVIYKHRLELTDGPQAVEVKGRADVLDFQVQDGRLTIWTLENYRSDDGPADIRFLILGTGSEVFEDWSYVGTVQDGDFVWHLFREMDTA